MIFHLIVKENLMFSITFITHAYFIFIEKNKYCNSENSDFEILKCYSKV